MTSSHGQNYFFFFKENILDGVNVRCLSADSLNQIIQLIITQNVLLTIVSMRFNTHVHSIFLYPHP